MWYTIVMEDTIQIKKQVPLTLMYELYKVTDKKTNIQGFWKDDTGKIYVDNIEIQKFFIIRYDYFQSVKKQQFDKGELAVFYTNPYGEGIIEDREGNKTLLKDKVEWKARYITDSFIEKLLNTYGGVTVFKEKQGYRIIVYKGKVI